MLKRRQGNHSENSQSIRGEIQRVKESDARVESRTLRDGGAAEQTDETAAEAMGEDAVLDEDIDCAEAKEERGVEGRRLLVAAGDEVLVLLWCEVFRVGHFDRRDDGYRGKERFAALN